MLDMGMHINMFILKNEFRLFLVENKSVLADWFDNETAVVYWVVYMADISHKPGLISSPTV